MFQSTFQQLNEPQSMYELRAQLLLNPKRVKLETQNGRERWCSARLSNGFLACTETDH